MSPREILLGCGCGVLAVAVSAGLWWALLTWPLQAAGVALAGLAALVLCQLRRELRRPEPLGRVLPGWRRR